MTAEIYLTGTVSPEDVAEDYPEQSFTDEKPDDITDVDGLFIGYEGDDYPLFLDAVTESAYAEGVPVVIFNDSDGDVDPVLQRHSRYVDSRLDQAMSCALMYGGVSAEEVISKG